MSQSKSLTPISNQAELKAACEATNVEIERINKYLAVNGKAEGSVAFIDGTTIGDTKAYDEKLKWLFQPNDATAIKEHIAYIQYLTWQKQCGSYEKYLLAKINKSILISVGSIVEALVAYAYIKVTGLPSDKIKSNLMELKYANAITIDLEVKIEQVWNWRRSIHLQLGLSDQRVCTQANVDQALAFLRLVVDELYNHFFVTGMNISRK